MTFSEILGIGAFVPPKVVTNQDLQSYMDTSDEWIVQRTGIKQRHFVEGETSTSDLALRAAEEALRDAKVDKRDLDLIIFATLSPDVDFPGSACFLQAKLEIPGIAALDIRQQCTGFIYGLSIADQFIKTGAAKKVLVVGAEVHSKGIDLTDRGRDVAVLFGDGAGAVVLGSTEDPQGSRILSTHLHADGRFAKELWMQAPSQMYPHHRVTKEVLERGDHFPKMNGKLVFLNAVQRIPETILEATKFNGISIEEIDLFVLHQANQRINEAVAKHLKIPSEKIFNTIEQFGNTTAATIPLGLYEAKKAGKLKKGSLVCSAAFGSGFTWGSVLYRW